MIKTFLCSFTVFLMVAVASAQDTFNPRDANEALAMRLHDWYVQSQRKLADLQNELPRAERNARQFINLPGDHEDLDRFNQIKAEIEREQIWSKKIVFYWQKNRAAPPASERSFAGRYGPLSESSKRSTDGRYDQVEAAIRSFPFNAAEGATTPFGSFSGRWTGTFRNTLGDSGPSTLTLRDDGNRITGDQDGVPFTNATRQGSIVRWSSWTASNGKLGPTTYTVEIRLVGTGKIRCTYQGEAGTVKYSGSIDYTRQ